jgi:Icc-related predicted phosphoesterase
MKIVCISDTHGREDEVNEKLLAIKSKIGCADLLIHCGDITNVIEDHLFEKFDRWCAEFVNGNIAQQVIATLGNHDQPYKVDPTWQFNRGLCKNYTLLCDEQIVINGFRFYGLPYTRKMIRDEDHAQSIFDKIPQGVDVLMAHGPVRDYGDAIGPWGEEHIGSLHMKAWLKKIKPKYFVNGHNHSGAGEYWFSEHTKIINACVFDDAMNLTFDPIVFEI